MAVFVDFFIVLLVDFESYGSFWLRPNVPRSCHAAMSVVISSWSSTIRPARTAATKLTVKFFLANLVPPTCSLNTQNHDYMFLFLLLSTKFPDSRSHDHFLKFFETEFVVRQNGQKIWRVSAMNMRKVFPSVGSFFFSPQPSSLLHSDRCNFFS